MSLQSSEKRRPGTNSKVIDLSPKLSVPIDLTLSNSAVPPAMGSIRKKSQIPRPRTVRTAGQKLTYGDAFCGGGGATRGATMAGLRVRWGFDHWEHACETWRANFPHATCHHEDAHGFVQFAKRHPDLVKVDILHLSPPCQFFSPAHTINGRDDEMNTASLFAVLDVIKVSKPRIVTLEQTFGICHPRFRFYFNALIHMFTAQDFSIRWAIIPLAQWGLPARRMRLIMIAACPGEILPRIPAATHSESGGATLKPFTSVQSVLSSIPRPNVLRPDPLHDPAAVAFPPNKYLTSWDATKILPRAMTTSGGGNWHPSGERDFTLREYAALQGFPQCHLFKGKCVKKQIGNAVPPCVAKVLFESIKRDLDVADGVENDAELI
ncbi:S-adenosyl-L-methionine-dependent methyltransferase, partial [Stipitochalara longipes BDJ]